MGLLMGVVQGVVGREEVNNLFLLIQPAHLQKWSKKALSATMRDQLRADLIRKQLSKLKLEA